MASSPYALVEVFRFHIDEFQGKENLLLKDILIRQIYYLPNFEYSETYPNDENSAVISANVLAYSAKDHLVKRQNQQIRLVSKEQPYDQKLPQQQLLKNSFQFIEVPHEVFTMYRTLELQIEFKVTHSQSQKILYQNLEKIAYQQRYIGNSQIHLAPEIADELERLGTLLIKRFLNKLNPVSQKQTLTLETGYSSWFWNLWEQEHPGILKGNRYAAQGDYEQALKTWSYVTFFPSQFGIKERFTFSETFFEKIRMAQLPSIMIDTLLEYYGKTFSLEQINTLLPKIMTRQDFIEYANLIKIHARHSQSQDTINLAATHYNLGSIYQIQNKLKLASYHLAQANAYDPKQKYAQKWTDIQSQLGTIDLVTTTPLPKKLVPPQDAKIQPHTNNKEKRVTQTPQANVQPIPLPILIEENKQIYVPSNTPNTALPQLNLD